MISEKNIELWLFRLKEGMLSADESAQVRLFLTEHPEWQEQADLYDPTLKAPSYPKTSFPDKEQLRAFASQKSHPYRQPSLLLSMSWHKKISVAASLLLLMILTYNLFHHAVNSQQPTVIGQQQTTDGQQPMADSIPSRPTNTTPQKAATTVTASRMALPSQEISNPSDNDTEHEAAATSQEPIIHQINIIVTDKLITYLDNDTSSTFLENRTNEVIVTERLITYMDSHTEPQLLDNKGESQSRPEWTYTVEDWWNSIQLAYTEHHTELTKHLIELR